MKLFRLFILSLLFCPLINAIAQDAASVEKHQFKINVLLPGFVYEHGFTTKKTLYSELSLGVGYRNNDYYGLGWWSFYPTVTEQFRHYYNLEKRASKGKVTDHNSGGFIALNANYNFRPISSNEAYSSNETSFTIAPIWGFQRTYKANFNLGLNVGAGYTINNYSEDSGFVPVVNFSLGWVIGK